MKKEPVIILLSEFLKETVSPFVLGAFFSRYIFTDDKKYICTYSYFKLSIKYKEKRIDLDNFNDNYMEILNRHSKDTPYWNLKKRFVPDIKLPAGQIFFVIENDLNILEDNFFNLLYSKIIAESPWLFEEEINESKKEFIRGFMELRGSIDTSRDYITQDYFYNSIFEIKRARLLVDYLSVPYYLININFRDLQKDFYTNKNKRNTQLRMNLMWYMSEIGILNSYKADIFSVSRNISNNDKIGDVIYFDCYEERDSSTNILDDRLNYYSTNIFGKEITDSDVNFLRANLGFDDPIKTNRNYGLSELIRLQTPDECMSCKNKYELKDRTHIHKRTGRYYFEIHHMISLGRNQELDHEDNLVKLCPICHSALKRNVSSKEEQIEIIKDIYQNTPNVLEFAQHFYNNVNFNEIVELTYLSLK